MFTALLGASLLDGAIPITVYVLGVAILIAIVLRRPAPAWALRYAIAAAVGLAIGFVLAWYLGDVRNLFGVTLTFATRAWFAVGIAGAAISLTSLWRARGWRIATGIAGVLIFALVGGIGINASVGEFPTLRSALGASVHRLRDPFATPTPTGPSVAGPLWQHWHAPSDMPRDGQLGTEVIPATVSHFRAQRAVVYLPPAALVRNAPALPVLIFLGGQPGTPQTVVNAGQLPELMNEFERTHDGLSPIVVVPDQLGAPQNNPMCLDSRLGNVATYLTVDVPHWIKTHLNVLTSRTDWTIGGFSEGGTCSIQLGTEYRRMFGNIIDISGEVAPKNGTLRHTIEVGFDGSTASYEDATPLHLLTVGAPFTTTDAVFAVGQDDTKYGPQTAIVSAAARRAGMVTWKFVSPGTAHDWYTEQYGLRSGLTTLAARWGLEPSPKTLR